MRLGAAAPGSRVLRRNTNLLSLAFWSALSVSRSDKLHKRALASIEHVPQLCCVPRAVRSSQAAFARQHWQPKLNHKTWREIESDLSQSPAGSVFVVTLLEKRISKAPLMQTVRVRTMIVEARSTF